MTASVDIPATQYTDVFDIKSTLLSLHHLLIMLVQVVFVEA